jgi:hypothetical protein
MDISTGKTVWLKEVKEVKVEGEGEGEGEGKGKGGRGERKGRADVAPRLYTDFPLRIALKLSTTVAAFSPFYKQFAFQASLLFGEQDCLVHRLSHCHPPRNLICVLHLYSVHTRAPLRPNFSSKRHEGNMSIFNRNRPVRDYAADKRDRDVEILRRILLRSPSAALCEELVAFKKSTQPLTRCAALMADTCRERECLLLHY